jgi:hypothetical protein
LGHTEQKTFNVRIYKCDCCARLAVMLISDIIYHYVDDDENDTIVDGAGGEMWQTKWTVCPDLR